ncbi:MAG: sulfite oxidase-like oxidoreductase [Pseudomonadota bacterium]
MHRPLRPLLLTLALLFAADAPAQDRSPKRNVISQSITINGSVAHTLVLRADDLRKYPPQQLEELPLISATGNDKGKLTRVKGVRLRALLEYASILTRDADTVKKLAIIATATDGYKVVFSWSELFNTAVGDGVLVLFERDGKALGEEEGLFALISAKDMRTGPRYVRSLLTVEVKQITD